MFTATTNALDDLRTVIASLGKDGGLVSPSVYDTAQLLRFSPPAAGVAPALSWLRAQQYVDGGWGEPSVPLARDISTMAAVLAIHAYDQSVAAREAVQAGLEFVRGQAGQWADIQVDAMPIAGEMILPVMLREAHAAGLAIDCRPYARVFEFHQKKRLLLTQVKLEVNTAPTYSWEALGQPFDPSVLDPTTGVGHSPAATAFWLAAGRRACADPVRLAQAQDYLARAEASTGTGIPGVVPVVYPITGFEVSYGLYALLLTGILDLPALQDVVQPKLAQLQAILERYEGLSFGDGFVADVDDTGVAITVLGAAHRIVDVNLVRRFWYEDHFYTYAHEINPSVFSNAHALHAIAGHGHRCIATEKFLLARQQSVGHWLPDKWHTSWRCTTMEVIAALGCLGHEDALLAASRAVASDQNSDGGWGSDSSSLLETTYGIMALWQAATRLGHSELTQATLERAGHWLRLNTNSFGQCERRWLGKEVYSPSRVDLAYKMSVLVSSSLDLAALPIAASVMNSIA